MTDTFDEISEWVDEYGNDLYRYALLRVGAQEKAEDLVQETLLAALKAKDTFRKEVNPKTWLRTILRNKIIDYYRQRSTESSRIQPLENSDEFNDWGIWRDPFAKWTTWNESPEEQLAQRGVCEAIAKCLNKLPHKQRLVITLRALDGLSTEEICKELAISPSNEWVLTYRARLALRSCLDKNWYSKR